MKHLAWGAEIIGAAAITVAAWRTNTELGIFTGGTLSIAVGAWIDRRS